MHELTEAMADYAGRDKIHLGVEVKSLAKSDDGTWTVTLSDGTTETGDGVISCVESWAAAPLIRPIDAAIADDLAAIPWGSSATISYAWDEAELDVDTNAFGVLCPAKERSALLAVTYSSSKWPGRAPKGKVLLRAFVGGPQNQEIMKKSTEELQAIVDREVYKLLGIKPEVKPLWTKFFRWQDSMPQYTMGHLDRVARIEQRSTAVRGLALAGGSFKGVGLPNCIETGEAGVTKVLADNGIVYDEVEEKRGY